MACGGSMAASSVNNKTKKHQSAACLNHQRRNGEKPRWHSISGGIRKQSIEK